MVKLVSFVFRLEGKVMLKLSEQVTSVQEIIVETSTEAQKL